MSENQAAAQRCISDDQIKEILMHHDRMLQENEQQIDQLKKQIDQMRTEHIPEEWIVRESLSGRSVSEVHTGAAAGGNDFSRLMAKYESYQQRRLEEKYRQIEAKMRSAETVCRVMYAYDVLPVRFQEVLRIIYVECGSYTVGIREAMEHLQVSVSTVSRRRKKGIEIIRSIFLSDLKTGEIINLTQDEVQNIFLHGKSGA